MKLFNSLTNLIEKFEPIQKGKVRLYSCGPTVYNSLHIGNLAAFIYADTLRRVLANEGYDIHHVMNITDVDDKTIRDSKVDYPEEEPMVALKKLTDKYTDIFMQDMVTTGNDIKAIDLISAVDSIPNMIELIQRIIDNGFAYAADDAIYFSIKTYTSAGHSYGLLQKVELASSQSRIANDEYDKDSASDFALWKAAEEGEPSWEANFSIDGNIVEMTGRPGWHIECSAMSEKLLGIPFDIHTGGVDLKFPHHENEIAQSCAAGASSFVNYFIHNNHILVDGRKMSKSLGNFYTLRDIEEKGYSPKAFRMLVLTSHYRNESNFSWDILKAAQTRLHGWQATVNLKWQLRESDEDSVIENLKETISNDLDTPKFVAEVDIYFNKLLNKTGKAPNSSVIKFIEDTLGIRFDNSDITKEVKELMNKRAEARATKDFQKSDELRNKIKEHGIGISDSPVGQIWYRL